jgi:hypothetical protein
VGISWWFLLALSLLLVHEMDAVRRHEWHILPVLAQIKDDQRGYVWFTALHVPLYVLVLWSISTSDASLRNAAVLGFNLFCMVHVALHLWFRKHPRYQFNTWFSWALILGAGIAGAIDLLGFVLDR